MLPGARLQHIPQQIQQMMRCVAEAFLDQDCPFYRPNPFHKHNVSRLPLQSRIQGYNSTLPIESHIDSLKLNNPFRNSVNIPSTNNNPKLSRTLCPNTLEHKHAEWKMEPRYVYDPAPKAIEESLVESRKGVTFGNSRAGMALQHLISKEHNSDIFDKEDLERSSK